MCGIAQQHDCARWGRMLSLHNLLAASLPCGEGLRGQVLTGVWQVCGTCRGPGGRGERRGSACHIQLFGCEACRMCHAQAGCHSAACHAGNHAWPGVCCQWCVGKHP
jgi:hypothetical protein